MANSFVRLLSYMKGYQARVYRATFYSILNKIADIAPPFLIGIAVDIVVQREDSFLASLGYAEPFSQLVVLAILTVIVWGVESVFEYLLQWEWRNLAQQVQHNMRVDTYKNLQTLDMGWFSDRKSGRLISILNDDINQLERFLDGGANDLIQVGTTAICVTCVFLYLSPALALLAMLPIPLIVWGSFYFQHKIAPKYAQVREKASMTNAQLSNNIQGMETIKSFNAEQHEIERIVSRSLDYMQANAQAIRLSAMFSPLIRMLIVIGFTGTLIYGGDLCLKGVLSVGTYSVLVFLTQRLLWPLTRLGRTFDLYQRAMASTDRVLDILSLKPKIVGGKAEFPTQAPKISYQRIQFSYEGREPLLKELSMEVMPAKTTAIVGATGSGKSTILRLLLRFYEHSNGDIYIDDKSIRAYSMDSIRRNTALVSQSVYLFDGTILENIAYGYPEATNEQIRAAAKAAEAEEFILQLPHGYDTLIGERGQKLSGGQRQRLAIARAILKNPPVLLLDEATSAVDNETEAAIQRSLKKIAQGRTVLIIAHRLSTIRDADQIVVMGQGRVVEVGTHEELIHKDGLYKRLWSVQTGVSVVT
ncbi:MAG: ABC transporter ATP-binding protein [Myxococcota bacterium]|nr:ABC transporter ATP-binding protein [Myxococcota bacterium]